MKRSLPHARSLSRMMGLSLVELMIAMTLGLATVGAIGYVYLGTSKTYRTQDSLARLQEGARYAFELISNDLRMTGATGCSYSTSVNVLNNYEDEWYTNPLEQPLVAVDRTGTTGATTEFSDALSILRADVTNEMVVTAHDPTGTFTFDGPTVTAGTLMLATDCDHVAVFQASTPTATTLSHASGGTPGNSTASLGAGGASKTFSAGSRLYRLNASTYYIANNPAGQPSLYRLRPQGASAAPTAEELVEGVEDLQVSFGIDTDATGDGEVNLVDPDAPYVTGDSITAGTGGIPPGTTEQERWGRVVSIRVSLLMRTTEDNVVPTEQTYTFNGAAVTATDKRLRKVFTHVVQMRNR